MKLRRYCVTVMDNWTPIKFFWTHWSAEAWIADIPSAGAHVRLYKWTGGKWEERAWTIYS